MIDFVSTRVGATPDTQRSAHLLASAVVQFIRDASAPPTKEELRDKRSYNIAQSAVTYLFATGSPFEDHAELLGTCAPVMRRALLGQHKLGTKFGFTETARRNIQTRHAWWADAREKAAVLATAAAANTTQGAVA